MASIRIVGARHDPSQVVQHRLRIGRGRSYSPTIAEFNDTRLIGIERPDRHLAILALPCLHGKLRGVYRIAATNINFSSGSDPHGVDGPEGFGSELKRPTNLPNRLRGINGLAEAPFP